MAKVGVWRRRCQGERVEDRASGSACAGGGVRVSVWREGASV